MIKKIVSCILLLSIALLATSCNFEIQNYSETTFEYFDTVTTVSGYFKSEAEFQKCYNIIEKDLENYHKLFDIYNNYDKMNNIKTINDNAGKSAVEVDENIIKLLQFGKQAYRFTNGNVNICMGSVLKLWSNAQKTKILPNSKSLNKAKKYISIDNLVIDSENNTVFLKNKNCSLDVGAIAKGFVCEQLKTELSKIGFENGIINIGGNVMTVGKKAGEKEFSVGIKDPDSLEENIYIASVSNLSVVTSGDYERNFEIDGKKYNHIISPKTLAPAKNNKSASVICENAAVADALSTALFISDYREGLNLINSFENCEALIIDKNSNTHFSKGFNKFIK
ncbi:MAG: FAD:protein FMN transferase [Acutalibacteraceae bacterium]|nr:FAD:protein FMN transferase [Acutalibacteraceae bacterium]